MLVFRGLVRVRTSEHTKNSKETPYLDDCFAFNKEVSHIIQSKNRSYNCYKYLYLPNFCDEIKSKEHEFNCR